MKKIKYIIVAVLGIATTLTSCYDMNLYPKNELGQGNFWKTERDIQMGLAGVYSQMKNGNKDWKAGWLDGMTDNAYCQHVDQNVYLNVQLGNIEPTSGGPVSEVYKGSYIGIAACNNFMKNFPQAKVNAKLSEKKADEYEAEVRFLRAWCYWELVQRYGDVPLYKEAIESVESSKVKQSPASEVYTFIYEDLDFAIKSLPDIAYGTGHAVKGSAQGLKARIALFREDWGTVETITKEIIASGHYDLADTYESIFIKREGQKNNPEILFSLTYLNPDYRHHAELEYYHRSSLTPLDDLINQYDPQKDKRLDAWYVNIGKGNREWTNPLGGTAQLGNMPMTDWICVKLFDKYNPDKYGISEYDYRTDDDVVIIRYADIYLMYIEAMVEKGNGTTTDTNALKYMNEIRDRAGLDPLSAITRNDLRQERRKELAFEGFRHFDIIRWKIGKDIMNKLETPSGKCKFEDHYYLWPFPQSEMDINPNLDQKPVYR